MSKKDKKRKKDRRNEGPFPHPENDYQRKEQKLYERAVTRTSAQVALDQRSR